MTLALSYLYVPTFFKLQLTSAYQVSASFLYLCFCLDAFSVLVRKLKLHPAVVVIKQYGLKACEHIKMSAVSFVNFKT